MYVDHLCQKGCPSHRWLVFIKYLLDCNEVACCSRLRDPHLIDFVEKTIRKTQVCRCAGQASSDMVYNCMTGATPSGSSGGMTAGNTLFLLLFVVGAMTAAGFVHYKRTQTQMRDQVRFFLLLRDPLSSPLRPKMGRHKASTGHLWPSALLPAEFAGRTAHSPRPFPLSTKHTTESTYTYNARVIITTHLFFCNAFCGAAAGGQVRGILAEYMPLEDIDAPGSSARVPFMGPDSGNTYAVGRTKESQLV